MKKKWTLHVTTVVAFALFVALGLASGSSEPAVKSGYIVKEVENPAPKASSYVSLEEALVGATTAVETKVAAGTEIAVYKIKATHDEIGDYLCDGLYSKFSLNGKLVPMAREDALRSVTAEQQLQMSGLVSDSAAVGIGHFLGAKVVITGTFDRFADFSQLRVRAVDVRTSAFVAGHEALISNKDEVLANITAPFGNTRLSQVSEKALVNLNRGKDLFAEGKLDAAIVQFNLSLNTDKNLADAYFFRAVAYDEKRNYDGAIADYSALLNIQPDLAEALKNRGRAYYYIGDFDKAIADNTAALKIQPDFVEALNNRGLAYTDKGNYDEAITDFNSVLKIHTDYATAINNRGYAYYKKGDNDKAIADYNAALRINPNFASALNNRGLVYYSRKDYDRAIQDFTAAFTNQKDFVSALHNRGIVYFDRGNTTNAINDFSSALSIKPDYIEALVSRGNAYYKSGDLNKAIADYNAALRINPNHNLAKTNLVLAQQDLFSQQLKEIYSIADFDKWLDSQPFNTVQTAYAIKLNVRDLTGIKSVLNTYPKKYVSLYFSNNTLTSIGEKALSYCTSLVSVTIPNSVTDIGQEAFSDCTSLASITIPDSVTRIGNWVFSGCASLASITIPDSVTGAIGGFRDCKRLTNVIIGNNVTYIGGFEECRSLTSITIGNSVTRIGARAFYDCGLKV